jgi:hypothetical protein
LLTGRLEIEISARFSVILLLEKQMLALLILFFAVAPAFAGRPLITDDASTQGKGKATLQLGFDYVYDDVDDLTVKKSVPSMEIDYGMADRVDLTVATNYQFIQIDNNGDRSSPSGISDTLLELKWRFLENNSGLGLALKPGIFVPTGNYTKGMGSGDYRFGGGKIKPRLYFVASQEIGPLAFHLNLGYMRNETEYVAQRDIWHASLAAEWRIGKAFKIICNSGVDTNLEKGTTTDPIFILGGVVYSVSDRLDLDFGIRQGIGEPGLDWVFTTGASIKF